MNKKNRFEDNDVVVTCDDPAAYMTEPGVYQLLDTVRGVVEVIEVRADGSRRVVRSESLGLPDMSEIGKGALLDHEKFEVKELVVGKLYDPRRTSWPEGMVVDITPGGLLLTQFMRKPTKHEIKRLRFGRFSMRLLTAPHTMLFVARFGDSPWADASFSAHRVPAEYRTCPPDPGEGYGWMLTAVIVDARNGVVRAIRQLALSRRFSCAVLRAYEAQCAIPADDAAHVREVMAFRGKQPDALAAEACERFEQGDTRS